MHRLKPLDSKWDACVPWYNACVQVIRKELDRPFVLCRKRSGVTTSLLYHWIIFTTLYINHRLVRSKLYGVNLLHYLLSNLIKWHTFPRTLIQWHTFLFIGLNNTLLIYSWIKWHKLSLFSFFKSGHTSHNILDYFALSSWSTGSEPSTAMNPRRYWFGVLLPHNYESSPLLPGATTSPRRARSCGGRSAVRRTPAAPLACRRRRAPPSTTLRPLPPTHAGRPHPCFHQLHLDGAVSPPEYR